MHWLSLVATVTLVTGCVWLTVNASNGTPTRRRSRADGNNAALQDGGAARDAVGRNNGAGQLQREERMRRRMQRQLAQEREVADSEGRGGQQHSGTDDTDGPSEQYATGRRRATNSGRSGAATAMGVVRRHRHNHRAVTVTPTTTREALTTAEAAVSMPRGRSTSPTVHEPQPQPEWIPTEVGKGEDLQEELTDSSPEEGEKEEDGEMEAQEEDEMEAEEQEQEQEQEEGSDGERRTSVRGRVIRRQQKVHTLSGSGGVDRSRGGGDRAGSGPSATLSPEQWRGRVR